MTLEERLTQTCTVTRQPATGETGETVIATDLACSYPYPAGKQTRERPDMATKVNIFEILTAEAAINNDDKITVNGRIFDIIDAKKWQSAFNAGEPFIFIIAEEPVA